MNRVLRTVFTLLHYLYFHLVSAGFALRNFFIPKRHAPFPVRGRAEDEIYFLSATEAARAIREGRLTSTELVEAYLDRVRTVEGLVKAVVFELGEEALVQVSPLP